MTGLANRPSDPWNLSLDDFHSADPPMIRCLELARAAGRTELPILVLGETGTGKTLLARAIHNSSRRAARAFVSFNAAALSDTLLDSQLFGHEKGAFTGADRQLRGKFELADGGTLFLDEIADMSPLAQAKILRAVEYGEYERLGSDRLCRADVRLISATHYPLDRFEGAGQFRRDLFYRISGLILTVPPLRERPSDLRALIASAILRAARQQELEIDGLTPAAAEILFSYAWPGNLRELDRVIGAAVALTEGRVIGAEAILVRSMVGAGASAGAEETSAEGRTVTAVPTEERLTAGRAGAGRGHAGDQTLATCEAEHVRRVLAAMGGNKTRAARALGISRARLQRRLDAAK